MLAPIGPRDVWGVPLSSAVAIPREYCLAERQEALDELATLDLEVEAYIAAATRRRRALIRRARRYERMAGAAGGVKRPVVDAAPWWAENRERDEPGPGV